ncbi:transporter substrate-binding domain-containing protein [Clostridiisalibacter paucivorans]|uniref:transporter substrate-binding domain-containing protein n=1 Tax=Clostridiisalibacter paucivorans TaxID=408753 RepID=UPI00047ECF2E|nr:transporter substrate-binding domain-containing protein [Clostridiisalibacter paucivorans]
MKKFITFVFIVLIIVGITGGCSNNDENNNSEISPEKELVVGMELAYPPFEMTDEKGNPTGISVDLAYALGEYLGRPVKIENMAYSGLIPSLTTKKIDLIISSMTITEDRKKTVDFSIPYSKAYLSLLISKDSPVEDFPDLNKQGVKVAVKKGTTGHIYATENLSDAEILVFEKENACVLEVVQGKADAFIYDQMTIFKNWKRYPDATKVQLSPFQEDYEYWGIAMRKDEAELKEKVNAFINEYKENGGFDNLATKYLKEQKEAFEEMNIPFFF